MKILSVTAQKPHSTGSGIYLTELVKGFADMGHEQAVVAGVYKEDDVNFPEGVKFSPVFFKVPKLPYPIAGMSDEMPYESTKYSQMTEYMAEQFKLAFMVEIEAVVESFCPDIILCHHLYLLTALIRDTYPDEKVICICHGTDLRQMKKNGFAQQFIMENMKKLDMVFALHQEQQKDITQTYGVAEHKIKVIGSGFNSQVFYYRKKPVISKHITIIYAGKLTQKKGVMCLISCLNHLNLEPSMLTLKLAGGHGNNEDYDIICGLIKKCRYPVALLGKLTQQKLAQEFRKSDIFVLPSFYEGLPLVLMEALACGLKVVATDLPGIRPWMDTHIPNHNIVYVKPPVISNTDEAENNQLPMFETDLAHGILQSIAADNSMKADLSNVSWAGVCQKIMKLIENIYK